MISSYRDIIQLNILKLIYLYYNDQLPSKITNISTQCQPTIMDRKLTFIPPVSPTYSSTKSLKNDSPVTWNNFHHNTKNNNFYNVGISKFKNCLKKLT